MFLKFNPYEVKEGKKVYMGKNVVPITYTVYLILKINRLYHGHVIAN